MPGWMETLAAWPRPDLLALAQVVLTVVGFGLTIWQIARSVSATERTNQAVANLQKRFSVNDLLIALPRLHVLEDALMAGLKAQDSDSVEATLVSFARSSGEIAELLEGRDEDSSKKMQRSLTTLGKASTKAKSALATGSPDPLAEVVAPVVKQLTPLAGEVSGMIVRLQREVSS